jgi:GT2 family glycosyltransferase
MNAAEKRGARQLGFVDRVTETQVIGWAVDLDQPAVPLRLAVSIDGRVVDTLLCGDRRQDLGAFGLPNARAGFTYDIPHSYFDGVQHRIAFRFYSGAPVLFTNRLGQSVEEWHFANARRALHEGFVDGLTDGGAINGWVFRTDTESGQRHGGNRVLVLIDGSLVGELTADRFRPDVGSIHRCDPYCGFSYIPPVKFRTGRSCRFSFLVGADRTELLNSPLEATFLPNDARGRLHDALDSIETVATEVWRLRQQVREMIQEDEYTLAEYSRWAEGYFARLRARVAAEAPLAAAPLVSIVCPVFRPLLPHLIEAVRSVRDQTYGNWELILADDASRDAALTAWLAQEAAAEKRIRLVTRRRNGGISAATNSAIGQARGDYVAFLDQDDLLVPEAIEVMVRAAAASGARLLYSDEDKIDQRGNLDEPHFKPDWNYRLLLGNNYVCHLVMMERALLTALGGPRPAHDGAQDHDLMLRAAEVLEPPEICHVPEILYHWRKSAGSTALSAEAKPRAAQAGVAAVEAHLQRRGVTADVTALPGMTAYRVLYRHEEQPAVTIVIPFKDQVEATTRCLRAILSLTAYRNYRVLLVDNWSESAAARDFAADVSNVAQVRVLRVAEPFNFSRLNNLAARETDAPYLMFMNNDLFVTDRSWLRVLVGEALAGDRVGAVGGKFVYPDNMVQHGGVVLGVGGVGEHAHRGLAREAPGYMARALLAQELSAVTAAGMLCDARAFREVGGFDEADLAVAFNDVDLCLKLRRAGWRVIWTPDFVAEHHESISRGDDNSPAQRRRFYHENQTMHERWGAVLRADPFYSPNFSRRSGIFRVLSAEREGRE